MSTWDRIGNFYIPRLKLVGLLIAAILGTTVNRASATVMWLLSPPELAARSDTVVVGSVVSVRTRVVLEADAARPYTFVQIVVDRSLAGTLAKGEVLILQESGGAWLQGTRTTITGNPIYREGERVLVFAQRAPHLSAARRRTTAMSQGKYHVARQNGEDTVARDLRGLSFASIGPLGGLSLLEGDVEAPTRLSDLLTAIKAGLVR